ncbi:proteophosphoglycan ppg4 [Rhodotorula toruloides]|uniref:Proteophosphoglycan ppg4 n=1 Tax=Rhodotorula toruloides TaxID=5286 RepID=A0A511K9Q0_RHOTO|nr:proteophosphoglycan ppg4 [Rhodotorula toruloides]
MASDSLEPPPPSPSAFPSLSPDTPSHSAPVQPSISTPAGTGEAGAMSMPANERRPHSSKERIHPSQNGKHSPYARPNPAGAGAKGVKKGPGAGAKGAKGPAGKAKLAPGGSAHVTEEVNGDKQPRTHVPGMPASMLPVTKKSHGRKSSTSSSPSAKGAASLAPAGDAPAIGKKRRASLRKVLPPTSSKLSALAPTFEFVPSGLQPSSVAVESSSSGHSSETEGESRPQDETDLLSASEKAAINETVSSAGAQGDAFVAKSFSQADAEGADVVAGTGAGEQSAKPGDAKAVALETATNEPEGQEKEETSTEPAQERSLGALLPSAFVNTDGTAFAPLSDLEEAKPAPPAVEQVKTERISRAVQESPVADILWREKQGWWNDDFKASLASSSSAPAEEPKPEEAGPAAVEPSRSQEPASETLLRFPPWTPEPPSTPEDTQRVRDVADVRSATPLGTFLNSAFVANDSKDTLDVPTSVEEIVASSAASPPPSISMPAPTPLSSFLSSSFSSATTPSALESFEPQAELAAERLAEIDALPPSKRPEVDFPLSAEEVAAQPSLDDVLDVDGIEDGKVVVEDEEKKPKEEKYGWWSPDYDPSRPCASSSLKDLVDEQKMKETVQSAGAQGDELRGKTFEQADRDGEVENAPMEPAKQSAGVTKGETAQAGKAEEELRDGSRTPLGEYLGQAFSSAPSAPLASAPPLTDSTSTASTSTPALVAREDSATPTASAPAISSRRSSSPPPTPSDNSNNADDAPSLTLALASAWHTAPWTRKIWAVLASLAINVGLPFVNGVMLGAFVPPDEM